MKNLSAWLFALLLGSALSLGISCGDDDEATTDDDKKTETTK